MEQKTILVPARAGPEEQCGDLRQFSGKVLWTSETRAYLVLRTGEGDVELHLAGISEQELKCLTEGTRIHVIASVHTEAPHALYICRDEGTRRELADRRLTESGREAAAGYNAGGREPADGCPAESGSF